MTEIHKNNLAILLEAEAHVKLAKAAWLRENNACIAKHLALVTAALLGIRFEEAEAEYALAVGSESVKPKKKRKA